MPDLSFLQHQITDIGTALFFCEDKDVLPYPAYIITALKTDEQGYIWFFISRNWNEVVSYDTPVAASLEFYRKGHPFSVKVAGQASLVGNKAIMQHFMQDVSGKSICVEEDAIVGVLLVKVKIENATYKTFITRNQTKSPIHHLSAIIKNLWLPGSQWQPSI